MELNRLQEILEDLNHLYFQFEKIPTIRWSKGRIQDRYRRLTLGSYYPNKDEIRIHPLFREGVLEIFVLRYVIYHELLHFEDRHSLKKRKVGERVHHREFHAREKNFPKYLQAQKRIREFMKKGY